MIMKRKLLLIAILLVFSGIVNAQNFTISGVVKNSETNGVVSSALIKVKQTQVSIYTDNNGYYSLIIPEGNSMLIVSAEGMQDKEVEITKEAKESETLDVFLDPKKEDDMFDMSLEDLMNVKVSGVSRYKQNISDVPNSIQVISKQQIKDRGYHDLSDLLKDVQGFDITANAGLFGEFYSLRGIAGNDRFLIMVNGHKLNPVSGSQISIGNSISVRYVDRVEIIYGPASAIYGADAFSGIINIIMDEGANKDEKINISAYGDYGSMNSIDAGLEASFKVNDNLSFYAMARMYNSDGPDLSETDNKYYDYGVVKNYPSPLTPEFQQPTQDNTMYFNVKYKGFSLNYYRQGFNEGNGLSLIPAVYIYNKENKWKMYNDFLWATYKKEFSNKGVLNVEISKKQHIQDENSIYYKWLNPADYSAGTYKQYMTGNDNTFGGVITYNQPIGEKLNFIVGVDNESTKSIPPYANDQVLGRSDKFEGENKDRITEELRISENRFSGFGQITYAPFSMLNIVAGARYDYSTRYGGTFNPRAGLIISPIESTKIKFIYGKAFQAPS